MKENSRHENSSNNFFLVVEIDNVAACQSFYHNLEMHNSLLDESKKASTFYKKNYSVMRLDGCSHSDYCGFPLTSCPLTLELNPQVTPSDFTTFVKN